MGIVKSFNLGGGSNQKMKQAIEESRARNTKLETVFGPYGMVQLFVLRLASVAIMFCSILFYLQGSMTLVYCLLMCVASFLIFSELEAAGGKSFALRLIESSIDKVNAIDDTPVMDLSGKDIERLTEDKTVIIIAHRLKTVRNAQQIVVIANGGIVQRGTHQELMEQPGIYADFVNVREKAINWKLSGDKTQ